jgi:predicted small lipoprotein YifL
VLIVKGAGIIPHFVIRTRNMPQLLATAALAAALYMLGGCGQTGPLYLPEQAPPDEDTAGTTAHTPTEPT